MVKTKNDHIYKITGVISSINLDGTAIIEFKNPVISSVNILQIPKDDFSLGDIVEFELSEIWTPQEWKEKFEVIGEIV